MISILFFTLRKLAGFQFPKLSVPFFLLRFSAVLSPSFLRDGSGLSLTIDFARFFVFADAFAKRAFTALASMIFASMSSFLIFSISPLILTSSLFSLPFSLSFSEIWFFSLSFLAESFRFSFSRS